MARDKNGRTLKIGDPVSIGDNHLVGTIRTAQVAQTCVTVDWTDKDAFPEHVEGSDLEFWGPEEQRLWAEARDADMPPLPAAEITVPAVVEAPKPPKVATNRAAHKAK